MNSKTIKIQRFKKFHWLLNQWQKTDVNSGKNLLLRGLLLSLSLSYILLVTILFLFMFPVILISTTLIAFIVNSGQT